MGSSHAEIKKHNKIYTVIFVALLILTGVTVAVAEVDVGVKIGIGIALIVACVKGGLVAAYFMHLTTEKGPLFWVLGLTMLFFFVLLLLPTLTLHDNPMAHFVDSVSGQKIME